MESPRCIDAGGGVDGHVSTTTLRNGLVHVYTLSDSATLLDKVGTAHATSVKASESGIASRTALRFSKAASDIIRLPTGMLGGLTKLTVCVWFRADGTGALFSWKGPSSPGGLLGLTNGYMQFISLGRAGTQRGTTVVAPNASGAVST